MLRRQFTYLPFIRQLLAMYANSNRANEMEYRAKFDEEEDVIQDIFDSQHYRTLRSQDVVIDHENVGHKFSQTITTLH